MWWREPRLELAIQITRGSVLIASPYASILGSKNSLLFIARHGKRSAAQQPQPGGIWGPCKLHPCRNLFCDSKQLLRPSRSHLGSKHRLKGPQRSFAICCRIDVWWWYSWLDPIRHDHCLAHSLSPSREVCRWILGCQHVNHNQALKFSELTHDRRTIVQDSFASLVDGLQESRVDGTRWSTKLDLAADGSHYTFSVLYHLTAIELSTSMFCWHFHRLSNITAKRVKVLREMVWPWQLWTFSRVHFLCRSVSSYFLTHCLVANLCKAVRSLKQEVTNPAVIRSDSQQIVWQTNEQPFQYGQPYLNLSNITLNVMKTGSSQYLGFGEQGGQTLLKSPSFMNYYCRSLRGSSTFLLLNNKQVTTTPTPIRSITKDQLINGNRCK